jgi:hypothetical protein
MSKQDLEKDDPKKGDQLELELETDDELTIEIEDDTPEQDRNRQPLPKEKVKELEDDELENYSERVKERMAQLKKVWHDERRAKEEAAREREEAIRFARSIAEENQKLKSTLTSGEKTYADTLKQAADAEVDSAKREYREAYESGDSDKIVAAQEKLNKAQIKQSQAENYRPRYQNALQEEKNEVQQQPSQASTVRPDSKALAWQEQNEWFGQDEEMTSLALGLHEKLVKQGISPTSDEYYRRIDDTMRKRFPEQFEDDTQDEEKPAPRRQSTVVAPATRSTAPKKVRLTKTQLGLAKKLGLTPEQYALEVIKLENRNG